jgi:FlaA1/EpsC-like NDP-sugar epimerase
LFSKQIADGGPITITHLDIIRYFMTIPEAQLVLEAGAMGKGGVKSIFLIWVSRPETIDLARKMIKLAGFIPEKHQNKRL